MLLIEFVERRTARVIAAITIVVIIAAEIREGVIHFCLRLPLPFIGVLVVRVLIIRVLPVVGVLVVVLLLLLLIHSVLLRLLRHYVLSVVYALVIADNEEQYSLYGEKHTCKCKQNIPATRIRLEETDQYANFQNHENEVEKA